MKFIISLILTAILSFAACLYLPWWSIAIVAFIVAIAIPAKPLSSFISGFIALFLLWSLLALYISTNNGHLLAHKISVLLLKTDDPFLLIIITGLIGGLVAGFAALTGTYARKVKG
jgi:hypothetical protein